MVPGIAFKIPRYKHAALHETHCFCTVERLSSVCEADSAQGVSLGVQDQHRARQEQSIHENMSASLLLDTPVQEC